MNLFRALSISFWLSYRKLRNWMLVLIPLYVVVLFLMPGEPQEIPRTNVLVDEDPNSFNRPAIVGTSNHTPISFNLPYEASWRQHAHLVTFAVLACDREERRVMRESQRRTWLYYPDVARRATSFEGLMLVLYAIAPFNTTSAPFVSGAMMDEMETHQDVLLLRMKEEPPSLRKIIGRHGFYGLSTDTSNTRKLMLYMLYAYNAFPTTPFIGKGDDDAFVYVPEYLRMVKQLPRISTVYGNVKRTSGRRVVFGMGYLFTRDIVHDLLADGALNVLLILPYMNDMVSDYAAWRYQNEDYMSGVALQRLYGPSGTVRALPEVPAEDPRLPAPEGWGGAYMAYVQDPVHVPHTGRAVSSDGRYNVTYVFPDPSVLRPGNVLWVDDKRIGTMRKVKDNHKDNRLIIAHRPITSAHYDSHWNYHARMGEDVLMPRPQRVVVSDETYFYDVSLEDMHVRDIGTDGWADGPLLSV